MLIRIDDIQEDGNLRRIAASAEADAALTTSIAAQGVLQPILVRPNGAGYVLVAGARRLRCARAAGLEEIPVEVCRDLPAAEKSGLTKAGRSLVLEAKTVALRETLRTGISEVLPERLMALMVLAWTSGNVTVSGDGMERGDYSSRQFRDLAARVLLPGGGLSNVSITDARMHAAEVMARVLTFGSAEGAWRQPSSGEAAEWIGAAIGADQALPRFDTEEFLKHVGGDELRRAATAAGEKATGTVKSLRERLVGRMPNWRPDAAAFGAPAPAVRKVSNNHE